MSSYVVSTFNDITTLGDMGRQAVGSTPATSTNIIYGNILPIKTATYGGFFMPAFPQQFQ
jgi:hypothetical protein